MKRILLPAVLLLLATGGIAQTNSFIGIYAGGGIASSNNYNVALSGGLLYMKGLFERTGLGLNLFYQQYYLLYDNEAYGAKNFTGPAGEVLINKSSYFFVTPQVWHSLGRTQSVKLYFNAGVGFGAGGTETVQKWNNLNGVAASYDSSLNTSSNINKMLFRIGVGLREFLPMGHHWCFNFVEDFGFLANSVSSSGSPSDGSRTIYSPHNLSPAMVSLQIGIAHVKY